MPIASLIGIPIGIGAGIYLAEYGRGTRFANLVRFTADVLNGVPSIVMGIAIYALIVIPQKHFSALAGGVALGIMMIPTITRTTEEMLLMVPQRCARGRLGLGVPNWRTVLSITLRTARRASSPAACWPLPAWPAKPRRCSSPPSETSSGARTSISPSRRCRCRSMSMPSRPYDEWHRLAWAGALVLIVLIVLSVRAVRICGQPRHVERSS